MKLIMFSSPTCGPCRMMKVTIETLKSDYDIEVIDIVDSPDIAASYGVMATPTWVLEKNGIEAKRSIGAMIKPKLIAFIEQ